MSNFRRLSPRGAIVVWLLQLVFPIVGLMFVGDRIVNHRALGRYSGTLLGLSLAWFAGCFLILFLPRVRRWILTASAQLLTLYVSFGISLAGVEAIARARLTTAWEQERPRPRMEYSPDLGWKLTPGEDDVGEHGWRGPDRTPGKQPGRSRIVCIGDSTTFGWNCPWDGAWPHELEVLANQDAEWTRAHGVTEVVNLGVVAYGPDQALIVLQNYGLAYQPDVVIYHICVNDFADASLDYDWRMVGGVTRYKPCFALKDNQLVVRRNYAPPARDAAGNLYTPGGKPSVGFHSGFAMWLSARLDRRESGMFFTYQNTWPIHEEFSADYAAARPLVWALVREMARVSQEADSDFLVTLSPAIMNSPNDDPPWRVGSFLREYAEDADAAGVLARHCVREYFERGGNEKFLTHAGAHHLNSQGNLLIAEATLRWLKECLPNATAAAREAASDSP